MLEARLVNNIKIRENKKKIIFTLSMHVKYGGTNVIDRKLVVKRRKRGTKD